MLDEDTFTVPASWLRLLHPRRGGVTGPAPKVDRAAAWRLVDEVRPAAEELLRSLTGEQAVLDEALAYLRSRGAEATPRGAGLLATVVRKFVTEGAEWKRAREFAAFADTWVADHGLVFATLAAVEDERMGIGWEGSPFEPQYMLTALSASNDVRGHGHAGPLVTRLRAHLAAAGDDDYHAAVEAVAARRHGCDPLVLAFLFPDQADWVAAAYATSADNPSVLFSVFDSADVLSARASHHDAWWVTRYKSELPTVVATVGPAIAPALARWFDSGRADADGQKRLLAALAVLPTDEAFELLVARLDQKYVRPAVVEAMRRFPVRAARVLSAAGTPVAATLLRSLETGDQEGEATATAGLPALLVTPPWERGKRVAKPVVIADLEPGSAIEVAWLPGEREEWLAGRGWLSPWLEADHWEDAVDQFRAGRLHDHHEAGLFGAGAEELVRPLLASWQPTTTWTLDGWFRRVIARFEVDAVPAALHVARIDPVRGTAMLLPFASVEIARLMAEVLRLKSVRQSVLSWLRRHPRAAAGYLVPSALTRPGKDRRAAEAVLRILPAADVVAAAASYGPAAEVAIKALLDTDPLDVLPSRIPKVPDWVEPGLLPPVVLRDGAALPAAAVRHVVTMLALSRPGAVYAGVEEVRRLCTPGSLAEFAWGLFQAWQQVGLPSRDGWVLDALGWLGDDETVRRLSPVVRAWPGDGQHTRAVNGLDVLAEIGTDVALMHLHGIAQKVKFKGLRTRAQEKVAAVAAALELTPEQLGDRLVPDLGLDAGGSLTLDYGPRRFVVGFDEQLKPYVADPDGTRRKDLPKPGAADDPDLASAARARFAALKKDARTIAADQVRRLEQAMVAGRRWTPAELSELFITHPLLWHIVRRLVWCSFDGDTLVDTFRIAEDRTLASASDELLTLPSPASVGIAHPVHLGSSLPDWVGLFADYAILQPFPQLGRPVHELSDDERAATSLSRFEGLEVPTGKVLGLTRRGWQRAAPQDNGVEPWLMRPLPGGQAAVINLQDGLAVGALDLYPEQRIEHVWLSGTGDGDWAPRAGLRFGELDAVSASELLADLTDLTG